MTVSVGRFAKNIAKRAKVCAKILTSPMNKTHYIITHETALRSKILDIILDEFQPSDSVQETLMNNAVDRIYASLTELFDGQSLKEKIELSVIPIVSHQSYYFAQVCALASIWELHLRIFARRIGVETYKRPDSKPKKSKNINAIVFEDLSIVIDRIKAKTKFLKQNLKINADVRGALVHGNFQALRQIINATIPKKEREKHRGNVMMISLDSNDDIRNMADEHHEPEKEDHFGWMLEGMNSELLRTVLDLFEEGTKDLRYLIGLKAYCHSESEGLFEKIVFDGDRATEEEVRSLSHRLKENFGIDGQEIVENAYKALKIQRR